MSTRRRTAYAGEKCAEPPVNFPGDGAPAEVMAAGSTWVLGDQQVKSVFVNVFGITRAMATGDRQGAGHVATKPTSRQVRGSRQQRRGRPSHLPTEANHLVTLVATMDEAAGQGR